MAFDEAVQKSVVPVRSHIGDLDLKKLPGPEALETAGNYHNNNGIYNVFPLEYLSSVSLSLSNGH